MLLQERCCIECNVIWVAKMQFSCISQILGACYWVMRKKISWVSVGEQGQAMAPGQPPGGKCSPDRDNIQFLPCEMQKSTPTSAKCFIILYQIRPPLSFCYTHLQVNVHFLEMKKSFIRTQIHPSEGWWCLWLTKACYFNNVTC